MAARVALLAVLAALVLAAPAAAGDPRADLRPAAPQLLGDRTAATLRVVDVVRNRGSRRAGPTRTRFVLSRDAVASSDDLVLGERAVAPLRPRRASRRVLTLRLPAVAPGTWTVIACADAARRVRERRERDNCRAALLPVRIPAPPPPPALPPPPPLVPLAEPPPPAPPAAPAPPAPSSTEPASIEDCGPAIPADDAPAAEFTAMFAATTTGWTGGDGTFSVRLPGGDTAWMFGDTFLGGLAGDGRDQPYPYIRNSVVVQGDCLSTRFRGTPATPFSFELAGGDAWYWVNQPVVHGDRVRVFLTRMVPAGELYAVAGSALATYDLGLGRVAVDEDVATLGAQWWGAAIVDEAPYTYVFGIQDANPRGVFLARTPYRDLDGAWEYRTQDGWSEDLAAAEPVLADASRLATQISVLRDGDDWVLVSQDAFPGRTVGVWRGTAPWDWGPRATLATLPEIDGGLTYNALVHPQFTAGDELLLSYNVIATSPEGTMADAALYRPRFIRRKWNDAILMP